jgi:hypothetical protein
MFTSAIRTCTVCFCILTRFLFLQNVAQQHVIADMMPSFAAVKTAQQRPSSSLSLTPAQGVLTAAVSGVGDDGDQLAASAFNRQEHPKLHEHELLLLHRDDEQQQQQRQQQQQQQQQQQRQLQQQQRSASASRHFSCVRIMRLLAAIDHVSLLLIRCLEDDTSVVTASAPSSSSASSQQQAASDACGRMSSCLSLLFTRLKSIKCGTSRNRSNTT